jgi:hypothetical protein
MNQQTIFPGERDLTDIACRSSKSVREVRSLPNTIGGPSRAVRQVVVESNRALENTARDSCPNRRLLAGHCDRKSPINQTIRSAHGKKQKNA